MIPVTGSDRTGTRTGNSTKTVTCDGGLPASTIYPSKRASENIIGRSVVARMTIPAFPIWGCNRLHGRAAVLLLSQLHVLAQKSLSAVENQSLAAFVLCSLTTLAFV